MNPRTTLQFFGIIFLSCFSLAVTAQPAIQWQRCIGGSLSEQGGRIKQAPDGGFIVVGTTSSNDGDVTGNHDTTGATTDILVVKLDDMGNIQWSKCLGGSQNDYGYYVTVTQDSGYLVACFVASNDGDVVGNHGGTFDAWLVKLDGSGNIQWSRCYGGTASDSFLFVKQLSSGDFVITGGSNSNDGDLTSNHGMHDLWALRVNDTGAVVWQKSLGGTAYESGFYIDITSDGGYIVGGPTQSNDGDVSGHHGTTSKDYWLVKLDSNANIVWQKCLGGFQDEDGPREIRQTPDSGFVAIGWTQSSNNGNVTGNHGGGDFWMFKTDASGTLLWQKCLGGSADEFGHSMDATFDDGYILSGHTQSNNTGNVTGFHGGVDVWIAKVDSTGNLSWQKSLGSLSYEYSYSVIQARDSGFVSAGLTNSPVANGDVSGNHSSFVDIWVVKLFPTPVGIKELSDDSNQIELFPNPATDKLTIRSFQLNIDKIEVYDILGKRIQEIRAAGKNEITIGTSYLTSGLYFIRIYEDERQVTMKFLKQ